MLGKIQQQMPDLSRAEQRVARWVTQHPKRAAKATLAEVARECGASEPTVIRFCRRIGLGGFRDFTIELTAALSRPASYTHRDVRADDDIADAAAKVMESSIQALVDVRSRLSSMPIAAAVQSMSGARQLAFAGLGASGHVALDSCHKFFRLGIPCTPLTDTPTILQYASIAGPGDVLIVVSQTGRWPEISRAAELAQNGGAAVIALTNPETHLAAVADIVFPYYALEDTSIYTPMSSRLAQLALLDALQVALALEIGAPAMKKLRQTKNALLDRITL
ncbi:MAG: MurR/RpiR family transcriptional regulator [Gammaproteobacteria bacterium]|nr:MurR/RpiR family transcriptional regulator [Gammaproteobacteria bacterium]MDH3433917.1 MurR/RpiR family transcriptional regulator [Gammaproteobacteria bacterium]